MSLFVDTSVWSLAFRRASPADLPEVRRLVRARESGESVVITGLVLQELLQGFSGPRDREAILQRLSALPSLSQSLYDRLRVGEAMDAVEFVRKWSDSRRERQGSQSHFIDLCALLGVPSPTDEDPQGDRYCFERGAEKVGGGDGWADVWRNGCFGREYKGKHANLAAALRQLQAYALNLENPPYLVVSDMDWIEVHTNWTNTVSRRIDFTLQDLLDAAQRELRRCWNGCSR